jgi:aspartokinase-like uncharacterized kinase
MSVRRVVKVGGSCLDNPQLVPLLTAWFADQPAAENWIIVGGGASIDAMRDLAARFTLSDESMHWRCVRMLRATFEILSELFPVWQTITTSSELRQRAAQTPIAGELLVAVDTFYARELAIGNVLPVGWATTTDSIAAFLALQIGASELVLLKSCPTDMLTQDVYTLSQQGIVDDAFPEALPSGVCLRIESLT